MKSNIIIKRAEWRLECRMSSTIMIHFKDFEIYEEVIRGWEDKLMLKRDAKEAGALISRTFRIYLKDYE